MSDDLIKQSVTVPEGWVDSGCKCCPTGGCIDLAKCWEICLEACTLAFTERDAALNQPNPITIQITAPVCGNVMPVDQNRLGIVFTNPPYTITAGDPSGMDGVTIFEIFLTVECVNGQMDWYVDYSFNHVGAGMLASDKPPLASFSASVFDTGTYVAQLPSLPGPANNTGTFRFTGVVRPPADCAPGQMRMQSWSAERLPLPVIHASPCVFEEEVLQWCIGGDCDKHVHACACEKHEFDRCIRGASNDLEVRSCATCPFHEAREGWETIPSL